MESPAARGGSLKMKNLIIILGPPAVGKMTVGFELSRLTGIPLFHNHTTIDLVLPFFEFGTPPFIRLVEGMRRSIVDEVAASDLPGLIFTFVWNLDRGGDKRFIDELAEVFTRSGGSVCYAELAAGLDERLLRNESPLRLEQKSSKRDLGASRERHMAQEGGGRMNTNGDFYYPDRHLKLDNTEMPPAEAAKVIATHFGLT